jgi:hypothetical protein
MVRLWLITKNYIYEQKWHFKFIMSSFEEFMTRIHVGALIEFTYLGRQKCFPQLVYCGKK